MTSFFINTMVWQDLLSKNLFKKGRSQHWSKSPKLLIWSRIARSITSPHNPSEKVDRFLCRRFLSSVDIMIAWSGFRVGIWSVSRLGSKGGVQLFSAESWWSGGWCNVLLSLWRGGVLDRPNKPYVNSAPPNLTMLIAV